MAFSWPKISIGISALCWALGGEGRRAGLPLPALGRACFASGQDSHVAQARPALTWGGLAGGHPAEAKALDLLLLVPHIPALCQPWARPPGTAEGLSLESRTFPRPSPHLLPPLTVAPPCLYPACLHHSPYLPRCLIGARRTAGPHLDGY